MKKSELRQIIKEEILNENESNLFGHVHNSKGSLEDAVDSLSLAIEAAPKGYGLLVTMKKLLKLFEKNEKMMNSLTSEMSKV